MGAFSKILGLDDSNGSINQVSAAGEHSLQNFTIDGFSENKKAIIDNRASEIFKNLILQVLEDVSEHNDSVLTSAQNHYSPTLNYGFLHYLTDAMVNQSKAEVSKILSNDFNETYYIFSDKNVEIGHQDNFRCDFSDFPKAKILKLALAITIECYEAAAKKSRASQGLLLYMEDLYALVNTTSSENALLAQIKGLAGFLRKGENGFMSGGSSASFIEVDIESEKEIISMMHNLISQTLWGFPVSEFSGDPSQGGLSDTGESDRKKKRAAKKALFNEIVRPVLQEIYKTSDWSLVTEIEDIQSLIDTSQKLGIQFNDDGLGKIMQSFGLTEDDYERVMIDGQRRDTNGSDTGIKPTGEQSEPSGDTRAV